MANEAGNIAFGLFFIAVSAFAAQPSTNTNTPAPTTTTSTPPAATVPVLAPQDSGAPPEAPEPSSASGLPLKLTENTVTIRVEPVAVTGSLNVPQSGSGS